MKWRNAYEKTINNSFNLFNYDDFGQLKEMYRMENGLKKIIENYEYHYPEN